MSTLTPLTQQITSKIKPTWCPGCGNAAILAALKQALVQLHQEKNLLLENFVIVYGIGCCGNMADFLKLYGFHALHGRAIANAVGIKLANHDLKVLVVAGDGDLYGEGLNHLLAAARGNHDLTVLVHNNQSYSLTTGQASPTSVKGVVTKSTPQGLIEKPFNPLQTVLACHGSFVARGYAGQVKQLVSLIKQAVIHSGFSLLDVLQPCPTFKKQHNYQWFREKVYNLFDTDHNPQDFQQAWELASVQDKLPTGLFYQDLHSVAYHEQVPQLKKQPLVKQWPTEVNLELGYQAFI